MVRQTKSHCQTSSFNKQIEKGESNKASEAIAPQDGAQPQR